MRCASKHLLALTFGFCFAAGTSASAQTIDTSGTGTISTIAAWGPYPGTETYGQTFVAPGNLVARTLQFQLRSSNIQAETSSFIAAIYAWSGTAATGSALAQSAVSTVKATGVTPVSVALTGSRLTAGQSYVALFTVIGANAQGTPLFAFNTVLNSTYTDGQFVFSNDHNDLFSRWDGTYLTDEDLEMLLIFGPAGPNAAYTLLGLQSNSLAVRSVLSQRAAAATFALDYDCSVFDQRGFCVSVGFRNSQIGSNYSDSGETAGLLTAAYRVTQELRIGGFIDQNLVSQSPVGVDPKNTQPMLGAFAVYQESPSFAGLTVRAALAYQEGDLRITRPQLEETQAGTGMARTSAFAFGGEIAYGFPIDSTWVAQPYAGIRRSDSQRRGYTETTSDSVTFPITYNRFGQVVTSATAGLRLRGAITPEFSLTFGVGMEHDLDSKMDRYSGTSTIPNLETFSINASQQQNKTRAVGSAGMRYMIASNQELAFDASIRQLPYGNDPSITTMLRYSIGF